MHGSFGTLGILTRADVQADRARAVRAARATRRYTTLARLPGRDRRHAEARDVDFMDGIIHAPTSYVLCIGRFVDERAVHPPLRLDEGLLPEHAHARARTTCATPDYFFRYDRGVTNVRPEVARSAGSLFGKLMSSIAGGCGSARSCTGCCAAEHPTVTLDVFVPFSKVAAFLAWYERELGFFPLWCVPYRRVRDYEWLVRRVLRAHARRRCSSTSRSTACASRGGKNYHRMIEEKLRELGGHQDADLAQLLRRGRVLADLEQAQRTTR